MSLFCFPNDNIFFQHDIVNLDKSQCLVITSFGKFQVNFQDNNFDIINNMFGDIHIVRDRKIVILVWVLAQKKGCFMVSCAEFINNIYFPGVSYNFFNNWVAKYFVIDCIRQSRYEDYSSIRSHSDNLVVDLCNVYFGRLSLLWNLPHNAQECCQSPHKILGSLLLYYHCIFIGLSSSCSWDWTWKSSPFHTNNFR